MSRQKFILGVDWFSVYGTTAHNGLTDFDGDNVSLRVEDFPTPQFLRKGVVKVTPPKGASHRFCEILFSPRLSSLPPRAMILRIYNECLYLDDWPALLRLVLLRLDLNVISLSRIDLFADFNSFADGLLPKTLIKQYLSGSLLKKGTNNGYISFKDWGYHISGTSMRLPEGFKQRTPNINSITFGRKGYIQTQLYNKSLELTEVKEKPWIRQAWRHTQLEESSVWRLEFRIEKQGRGIVDKLLNVQRNLLPVDFLSADDIAGIFRHYLDRYFVFLIASTSSRKSRCREKTLFDFGNITKAVDIKLKNICPRNQTTLAGRRALSYLAEFCAKIDSGDIPTLNQDNLNTIRAFSAILRNQLRLLPDTPPRKTIPEEIITLMDYYRGLQWYDTWKRNVFPTLSVVGIPTAQ